jgi:hypothetical protein
LKTYSWIINLSSNLTKQKCPGSKLGTLKFRFTKKVAMEI